MGIRFLCPNGHKLNVKTFLAGKRGVCPRCGAKFDIPTLANANTSESARLLESSQSFVVDTISPGEASSASASPSVIVEIVDTEPSLGKTPESAVVTEPGATSAKRRARRRRNQLIISVLLLTVVVVLAIVLIWILKRG